MKRYKRSAINDFRYKKIMQEKLELEDYLEQSERLSSIIKEVNWKVLEEGTLEKILNFICIELVKVFEIPLVWIGLIQADGLLNRFAGAGDLSSRLNDLTAIDWSGLHNKYQQNIIIIDQLEEEWRSKLRDVGVRSIALIPMTANGQQLGLLSINSNKLLNTRIASLLMNFADQIAAAVNNIYIRKQIDIFTMALESAANAMMITDREGKIWWANPAFCHLTGYSWFEILGQNPSILKSGLHPKEFYQELWQKILSGKVWKGEIINKRKGGSFYTEEMTITPVRDELGELSNFIGIKEDITQRKQSESLLHRYRLLSEHANDIILFVRLDGVILEVNEAAVKAYGYSHEELLKLKIADLSSPDPKGALWKQICSAGEAGILLETVHCRKNGSLFPVEASAIGSRISDEWVVLAIIRDISERKEAEVRIKEARVMVERAERLASLGTMATGIAHEINQPLNSLKVTADSMLYWHKKGKQLETEKIMDNIRKISTQAERIDGIIKHMRSFVRSEQPSELTASNLKDVVEGALSLIGNQLASHGIMVNKKLSDAIVLGETTRLEEVVINLLVNAMQSIGQSENDDKIITCITFVEDMVILEISDTGIGIEEDLKERIFEPFFTTKPVGEGTGLGLSIVHSIVTSYKGRILVFNKQEGGATFRVEFPIPYTEGVG